MTRSRIWEISVATKVEASDAVAESLTNIFAQPASTHTDFETGRTTVSVFCEKRPARLSTERAALRAGLAHIESCGLHIGTGRISIRRLRHENWAESWKRHFKPNEIGDALLIRPSWSKRKPRKGQAVVVLDPGLSFGTGQHPTTEFCLRELMRAGEHRHPCRRGSEFEETATRRQGCRRSQQLPRSFLDIGTGSGILAIAAAKLGYRPVHAFDFDPEAVRIARGNAQRNGVATTVHITRGDVTKLRSQRCYDLVCANLIATLLIAERRMIGRLVDRDGLLVLAGILKAEFQQVQGAYEQGGFRLVTSKAQNEWRSGAFARPRHILTQPSS